MQLGEDVAVQDVGGRRGALGRGVGVEPQEGVRVPHRQHRLADALPDALLGDDEVAATQDRRAHEEPAHRVGAVAVEDAVDVGVVALGLGHLQAVVAEHDAVGDDLLERRAVEQCGGQHVEQVEPATGLADVLDDEVRRRVGVEPVLVLKRVVHLGEGHGAGVEPDVEDVRDAAHGGLPRRVIRVRPGQLVDVRAVEGLRADAEVGLELIEGAVDVDARVGVVVGDPHRDRGTPVAGPGDVPVTRALEPLAELPVADVLRDPLDLVVVELDHAVAERRDRDEPAGQCHVDQRLTGPPGVRVGVLDGLVADDPHLLLEVPDDLPVGVEDELTLVVGHQGGELAVHVDRDDDLDPCGVAGVHVILTEGRGLVDDTGTVLGRDVVRGENTEGTLLRSVGEVVEGRGVGQAHELVTGEFADDLGVLPQLLGICAHEVLGEQHLLAGDGLGTVGGDLHQGIGDARVDRECQVRGQGPRGSRPGQRGSVGELGVCGESLDRGGVGPGTGDREGHGDGRILTHLVGVVKAGLLVGQRGVLGPGIRQDAETLVDQTLVVEGLEGPDHGLHVGEVHGLVAVVEVDPAGLAGDVVLPLPRVPQH